MWKSKYLAWRNVRKEWFDNDIKKLLKKIHSIQETWKKIKPQAKTRTKRILFGMHYKQFNLDSFKIYQNIFSPPTLMCSTNPPSNRFYTNIFYGSIFQFLVAANEIYHSVSSLNVPRLNCNIFNTKNKPFVFILMVYIEINKLC